MHRNRLSLPVGLISRFSIALLACAIQFVGPCRIHAQTSLGPNVLVVYNSADADSTNVANYYAAKRAIPAANLCAITPPSTTSLKWNDFASTVKGPVRDCLTAVGWNNILYIVFTYNTPFIVVGPDNATYSLDQFIADIWDAYTVAGQYGLPSIPQPYYADAQSQGNVYVPLMSLAAFRSQTSIPVYSVWRLDAATAVIAQRLVDNAILVESSKLSGQACIDGQLLTTTADYGSAGSYDWDLRQAAAFAAAAGIPVTQDFNSAEFGTSPAPLRCDNAILYSGGYSFNHYNNAFGWNPGAIGFHLDSASAYSPRSGPNWAANALLQGITVTSGAVSEPTNQGLPRADGVFRNLFEGANVGDAFMRNTMWLKWTIINIGDPLYRPFPGGFPAVTAPANSLALNPRFLIGGNSSTGTLTLATPAPPGGATVTLKSGQTSIATVPPSLTIAAGQSTGSYLINTSVVPNDSPVYISAVIGTSTVTNTLVPEAQLATVSVTPVSLLAGASATGSVFLNSAAPAGGITVSLSSNSSAVTVPPTVAVSAGNFSATFPITTTDVPARIAAVITATYAGAKRTAVLTVNPVIISLTLSPVSVFGGSSTTLNKITLNGSAPQDLVINMSSSDPGVVPPATVTVPASTTASPAFTITTSPVSATTVVTIFATYNGTTKSANLTVNPIAVSLVSLSPAAVIGGVSTTLNRVTLNSPAPGAGATVALSSSDPSVTVPASVTVSPGATLSPYFTITTSWVSTQATVSISATYNGTKSASLTINPLALLSLTLAPTTVVGGVSATLNKVTLNGPAPPAGTTVSLTSSDPSVSVPVSVTVSSGATSSAYFTITTIAVSAPTNVTISASYNGVTKSAILTVNPTALLSLTLSPATVVGGASVIYNKVTLNGPAPPAGVTVNLASSDPGVTVPASVTVGSGATSSAYFTIATSLVTTQTVVTISASYNGIIKPANLTVTPLALVSLILSPTTIGGGAPVLYNKVTLNGPAPPAGAVVSLASSDPIATVPASVTVSPGASSSGYFAITTSAVSAPTPVTISATYSGVTKTANLTVNPIALLAVTLSPATVTGGAPAYYNKVTLSGPAPAGGITVGLTSSDPGVNVPASVSVSAGATVSGYFTITTSAVTTSASVTISASYNGVTKTAILTVNP